MEREEEQYEEWLKQVRAVSPVLTYPEELTRNILKEISGTHRKKRRRLINWCSAMAAGFLLCFLMYETYFYPASLQTEKKTAISLEVPEARQFIERGQLWANGVTGIRGNRHLFRVWKERQAAQHKQKAFVEKMYEAVNHSKQTIKKSMP